MASAEAAAVPLIAVEVAYCPAPHRIDLVPLQLPAGATVRDALLASGVLQREGLDPQTVPIGVWGRACSLDQGLRARDRVEIYRPLRVDPKEARRQRYKGKKALSGNPTR